MKAVVATLFSIRNAKFNETHFVLSEPVENSDWPITSFTETEVSETEVEATSEIEMVSPDISQSIEPQSPSENTVLKQSDLRRSQREKFAPKRYGDPVALPENIEIALNCSNASDPKTYEESLASSNASHWLDAMAKELKSLDEQKVWELVYRAASSPVIKGKWVFTTKTGPDGEIIRFKARFVAKGYSQIQGVYYEETFSPTISHVTVRTLLAIAAKRNLKVAQYDVKTAYLNSPLDDNDIFIELPQGTLEQKTKLVDF